MSSPGVWLDRRQQIIQPITRHSVRQIPISGEFGRYSGVGKRISRGPIFTMGGLQTKGKGPKQRRSPELGPQNFVRYHLQRVTTA
jgi:hypothetical protein